MHQAQHQGTERLERSSVPLADHWAGTGLVLRAHAATPAENDPELHPQRETYSIILEHMQVRPVGWRSAADSDGSSWNRDRARAKVLVGQVVSGSMTDGNRTPKLSDMSGVSLKHPASIRHPRGADPPVRRPGDSAPDGQGDRQDFGLTLPTAYHVLNTLTAEELLIKDDTRHYRVGPQIGVLSDAFLRELTVPEHLLMPTADLADATGETTYMSAWRGSRIVILASVEGAHAIRVPELQAVSALTPMPGLRARSCWPMRAHISRFVFGFTRADAPDTEHDHRSGSSPRRTDADPASVPCP